MPLVGGVVCGDLFPCVLPFYVWTAGFIFLIAMYLICRHHNAFSGLYGAAVFLFLFGVGSSLVSLQLKQTEFDFPKSKKTSVYQVVLIEKPEMKKRSILFHAVLQGKVQGDTLLQSVSKKKFLLYFPIDSATCSLKRGDELLISAHLDPPTNNGIPDEFDYARYLLRKGVSGTAYVPAGYWRKIGYDSSLTLRQIALDYRDKVVSLYRKMGFRGDELAVLSALTVGDKDELSEEIMETYSVAGASHVLALSGLHIGFLCALFLFLLSPLWKRWSYLKPFLLLLIILCLWGFAFFTGLSSSVVRAVIMCSIVMLSKLQLQKPLTLNTLSATAFLMLLYNPVWLFDVGFQLSFSAVAAIVLLQPQLYGLWPVKNCILRKVWGLITVSVAAQIGTAPLVMFYFSSFSTHFLLTNIGVIPWVSLIMYSALLFILLTPVPVLQQVFAEFLEALVHIQNVVLQWIEQLPLASIKHIWIDGWEVMFVYLSLLLLYRALVRRVPVNSYIALCVLLLSVSYHSYSTVSHISRRSVAFYNVRGCPSVHCLSNTPHSWLVCADSLSDVSYLRRALSPYWNHLHLENPTLVSGDYSVAELAVHNQIVSYAGKRICILCDNRWRNKVGSMPIPVDYLYISQGYKGDIQELVSLFSIDTVVLDSSLSDYYQDRIIDECIRLGISYLPLSEKGSVRILL